MIPILYPATETTFTSNGVGRLADCVSCLVTEERNGIFECEFVYPATGRFYADLLAGGIIGVIHDDTHDIQPFDIYGYSQPIDGLVTFKARHISYRLNKIAVQPYTASSAATALAGITTNAINACPFTFSTTKTGSKTFKQTVPKNARAILGGSEGSILDVYGSGEYKWDKWEVKLYNNRGTNKGKTIRYGKNLTQLTREVDSGETVNSIVPYWRSGDGKTVVTLPEWYVSAPGTVDVVCTVMDFSSDFQDAPSVADLRDRATAYLNDNELWVPKDNISIDFTQLWQTTEYQSYAALERVSLCDRVSVYYTELGITRPNVKVIKVTYDVLRERYTAMELGDTMPSFADVLLGPYSSDLESIKDRATYSDLDAAIIVASDLITGGLGGHVVINRDADGHPEEILIMDTDDVQTAVNVWRWNLGGLGHSHNGYNGPFSDVAITQDGKINADMILTGYISASRIQANTIGVDKLTGTISNGDWEIDLENGTMTIGSMKSSDFLPAYDGIYSDKGMCLDMSNKTLKATDFAVTGAGKMYARAVDIGGVTVTESGLYTNLTWSPSGTQDGYTMFGPITYRNIVELTINGLNRATVDPLFEYYDNGTLVKTVDLPDGYRVDTFRVPLYEGTADTIKIGLKLNAGESVTIGTRQLTYSYPIVDVPSNARVTFNGGIGVDGVTLDSSFLGALISGQKATVSAGGSNTLNIGLDTRGVLFTSSRSTAHRGAYLWVSAPSGNFVVTPILAASSLNITGTNGVMTIASTASSGYAAYALCISF